jgi:purine-cytosine permease-like protein
MMNKNDTDKTVESESCLKVSDWVTFLVSEKQGTVNTMLGFGMLFVALIGLVFSTKANTTMQVIGNCIVGIALMTWVYFLFRRLGEHAKPAGEILKKIMSGDLKDESSIRQEWKKRQDALKQAHRRAGSA